MRRVLSTIYEQGDTLIPLFPSHYPTRELQGGQACRAGPESQSTETPKLLEHRKIPVQW